MKFSSLHRVIQCPPAPRMEEVKRKELKELEHLVLARVSGVSSRVSLGKGVSVEGLGQADAATLVATCRSLEDSTRS